MSDDESGLLLPTFQFLIESLGFRVAASETSNSFDNGFVELTNGVVNIRVIRERGITNAEVSQTNDHRWFPVSHLRQIVLRGDPVENVTLEQQAHFISGHYPTIVNMLAPERIEDTVARVRDLGRERLKTLYPGSILEE